MFFHVQIICGFTAITMITAQDTPGLHKDAPGHLKDAPDGIYGHCRWGLWMIIVIAGGNSSIRQFYDNIAGVPLGVVTTGYLYASAYIKE